ncbi:GtrA family protein [Porticoccus hydrocarbonoclasticus]|uniref:GtrA family protein n=1 Tax=Porticoccus hydrocarbonoclasticus TaxID=1073414 RepID=UPI002353F3AF|nr:GtrA family protein [Porticoccus hydrocarbonoclasticus]|tara:strand:- start:8509 stop:8943 length:435 start_codon:yes stop_codon:yes gene_type:complete
MNLQIRLKRAITAMFYDFTCIRFLIVGILNTAFSYSVYAAFISISVSVEIASLTSLITGIAFSYLTQSKVVFKHHSVRSLLKFISAWTLIYLLYLALIKIFIGLGASSYMAGGAAIVPITASSFVIMKYIVFRGAKKQPFFKEC